MIGWIHIIILFIGIISQSQEFQEVSVDDIEIAFLKKQIQYINKDIINLQNGQDTKDYEEKLILFQKNITNISSVFNEIQINTTLYSYFDENVFENMNKNIERLSESIDIIKDVGQVRKIDRLSKECVEEIKKGNYGSAINRAYLINDNNKIEKVINEVYKDKNNFNNIRKFGDEIPSISLSFVVYKSLLNKIGKDNYLYLDLIDSIKKQILDQLGVDPVTRIEAEDILYEMKKTVGTWIADKLGKAVIHNNRDKELNDIIERIVYEIKDYKLFREIADISVSEYFPKNATNETYFENLLTLNISDKQVPVLIMYQSLLDHTFRNLNAYSKPFSKVVLLQKAIKNTHEILRKDFKNIEQIFKNTYDIMLFANKLISNALIHEFYTELAIKDDSYMNEIVHADEEFFIDLIERSINEVYGKKSANEIVVMLVESEDILSSAVGISVIYDKINKNDSRKTKNIAVMLNLEHYLENKLQYMEDIPVTFVSLLQHVYNGVQHTKLNVTKIFNDGLLKDTYTTTNFKEICMQIFNGRASFSMMLNLADNHFYNFDTRKLFDFVLSFPTFEQRLIGVEALQRETYKNSVYLIEIAEIYKKMMATKEYDNSIVKVEIERALFYLPVSIRNAVFAEEVYIKNLLEGGEYLFADYFLLNDTRDVYTRATWRRGNNTKFSIENTKETGIYKIKNLQFNEYLYASETLFNKNSRQVFLGNTNSDGDKWRFIPIDDGLYIKNMLYKEYLFAGSYIKGEERRLIFTWMSGVENSRGKWKIEDATTDY